MLNALHIDIIVRELYYKFKYKLIKYKIHMKSHDFKVEDLQTIADCLSVPFLANFKHYKQ